MYEPMPSEGRFEQQQPENHFSHCMLDGCSDMLYLNLSSQRNAGSINLMMYACIDRPRQISFSKIILLFQLSAYYATGTGTAKDLAFGQPVPWAR
jgi:hypothetical protein